MIGKRKAKGRMGGGGEWEEKYFAHSWVHFQGFPHSQFFKRKKLEYSFLPY